MKIKRQLQRTKNTDITPEERLFVAEYLVDFNGTKAVQRVKPKMERASASSLAQHYLAQECVQRELTRKINKNLERIDVSVESIIRELHRIAMTDTGDLYDDNGKLLDIKKMPEHVRRAISSIKTKEVWETLDKAKGPEVVGYTQEVKLWSKEKGLEMLGKHLQMWVEKIQLVGDITVVLGHRQPAASVAPAKAEVIDVK